MGSSKDGQVIGYKYFLGVDFDWCHGPVDRMTNLYVDNQPLNIGIEPGGNLNVDKQSLFGDFEGGIAGNISLLDGNETQVQDPYLVSKIGSSVPAYRGTTRTLLKGSTAQDTSRSFYVGNNPYLKKWSGEFQRIYKRTVGGDVVAQWQSAIAGVPLIEEDDSIISAVLGDQVIFLQVDLSSASNGYSGDLGTIAGDGLDLEFTKNKVINTLLFIRDRAQYNRENNDFLGLPESGTSGISVGIAYFRYTDGAANNNTNFISVTQEGTGIEALAPIPTDAQKTTDSYDPAFNFPQRGFKMYENATKNDIDDLINFVSNFVVVPDNMPDGSRLLSGILDTNVTNAYATVSDTSIVYSHILFSSLVSDDTIAGLGTVADSINTTLEAGTGEPIRMINHSGLSTDNQKMARNLFIWPSDNDLVTFTGGWVKVAEDTVITGGAEYMGTSGTEVSPTDANSLVTLPSGDPATTVYGIPNAGERSWWWGPLMTSGLYQGRVDVEEFYTRSAEDANQETTIIYDGKNLFTELSRDISTETNTIANDTDNLNNDSTVKSILSAIADNVYSYVEMNPAHIIRECLTDQQWGLGLPEADIDETTFLAAAQTLYDERFGVSLGWFRQEPIEEFVNIILNHIDAVLYVNRTEGKWVLKLIRDDYDPNTLVEYTDADVVDWDNISIKSPAELTNSVTISYKSRELRGDASLTVNNLAQVQQLGSVINTTVSYPGVWQPKLATRIAQRDLATLSTALIGGEIAVTRKGYDLNPGEVFKLTSSRYGLSGEIMRVIEVDLGDGLENEVIVKFTQDKFNLDTSANYDVVSVPDPSFVPVSNFPKKVDNKVIMEYPHYFFSRTLGETEATDREATEPNLGYLSYTGIAPTSDSLSAIPYVNDGSGYVNYSPNMKFCPYATLSAEVREYANITTLTLSGFTYYSDVSVGDLLMVNDEIMKVDSIDSTTQITVGRGCLDTVPAYHKSGSKVFFISDTLTYNAKEFVDSDVVDVKLLTVTGRGQLDPALAPATNFTFDARITRPYPVGKLQLDGAYSGVWDTSSGATTTATWVHRDRLLQTDDDPADFTDASIGPEASSDYTISAVAYSFLGSELPGNLFSTNKAQLLTETISSDAYSPTTEGTVPWSAVGVRVSNTRGSYTNFQTPEVLAYYPVSPEETIQLSGFWVDANQIGSLTQDTSLTTPVVYDGDPVGNMLNQRGF